MLSLATNKTLQHNVELSHLLTDHNYYNSLISSPQNRSSHVSLLEDFNSQCNNDNIDSDCRSAYNDENYAQSNNIETEIVCAELMELVSKTATSPHIAQELTLRVQTL